MTQSLLIYPELGYQIQGALYDVYNELRYFELSEEGWEKALLIALAQRGLSAQSQVEWELFYKEHRIGLFRIDILVEGKVLIEIKAQDGILPIDQAQILTYLKVTNYKLGILAAFGRQGLTFKRFANTQATSKPWQTELQPEQQNSTKLLAPNLTVEIRKCLFEVHNTLGPGFMHMHYRRATQLELGWNSLPFEVLKEITITYQGQPIETRNTRLIIVNGQIVCAPVALLEIDPFLRLRFRQYLHLLSIPMGIIANFHATRLAIETIRL